MKQTQVEARKAKCVMRDSGHQTQAVSLVLVSCFTVRVGAKLVFTVAIDADLGMLDVHHLPKASYLSCNLLCQLPGPIRKPGPALALTQLEILFPHRQKGNQDVVL